MAKQTRRSGRTESKFLALVSPCSQPPTEKTLSSTSLAYRSFGICTNQSMIYRVQLCARCVSRHREGWAKGWCSLCPDVEMTSNWALNKPARVKNSRQQCKRPPNNSWENLLCIRPCSLKKNYCGIIHSFTFLWYSICDKNYCFNSFKCTV